MKLQYSNVCFRFAYVSPRGNEKNTTKKIKKEQNPIKGQTLSLAHTTNCMYEQYQD